MGRPRRIRLRKPSGARAFGIERSSPTVARRVLTKASHGGQDFRWDLIRLARDGASSPSM